MLMAFVDGSFDAAMNIVRGAGIFFWLLLPLSLVAAFVFFERIFALRRTAVLPDETVEGILAGRKIGAEAQSALGRIARFAEDEKNDDDAIRAYARLEVNRMERGFVFMEFIVGAAPMVGLLGTVTALIHVFGAVTPQMGAAMQNDLTKGISLALSATFLGLSLAIPTLFGISFLQRRVETYAVEIESLLEKKLVRRPQP